MTIRCSRCGCAKFFYTVPGRENADAPDHHGACCAACGKPISLRDLIPLSSSCAASATGHAES